ncbi:hypothetical protein K7G98_35460, partial [Saccharothrix sp. MB29]|nr:hypothetical protein [Saccharothrix sp. MB29]
MRARLTRSDHLPDDRRRQGIPQVRVAPTPHRASNAQQVHHLIGTGQPDRVDDVEHGSALVALYRV